MYLYSLRRLFLISTEIVDRKRGSITQIGQDWTTTTLNALESPCDPQRSTVTHIHRKLNGTLAKKNYTIVDCGIARYGVYHFAEAIPRRKQIRN